MKPQFKLPQTSMCIVVWYRNGVKHEQLIDTPFNSAALIDTMLMKYHVGYSELRAVLAVDPKEWVSKLNQIQLGR
jgi:hypothetical protein